MVHEIDSIIHRLDILPNTEKDVILVHVNTKIPKSIFKW